MEPQLAIQQPPQPPAPAAEQPKTGIFALLDGAPAHALVIVGLALALLVPMILGIKAANRRGALAEVNQAEALARLDAQQFVDDKAKAQRRKSVADDKKNTADQKLRDAESKLRMLQGGGATLNPDIPGGLTPPAPQASASDIRKAQQDVDDAKKESDKAKDEVENAKKDLEKYTTDRTEEDVRREAREQNKVNERTKAFYEADVAAQGTSMHLVIGWIGRLMLLIGLIVMTVQSAGLRQKILLFVLLVVMFSSLSGIGLDFAAQGRMGGSTPDSISGPSQDQPQPQQPSSPNR
ncbi:MAG TPA: hypothetical protein VNN73_11330 [Blastocatellia bacterium]|nr:hypothetical protein [Blastocatellia bacterium]